MNKVLLVEDNKMLAKAQAAMVKNALGFTVDIAYSFQEAEKLVAKGAYFVALLDLVLPDAPNGEIVDLVVKKIPSIVFTATYDEETRNSVMEKGVLDYFIKNSIEDFKKVVDEVKRLDTNRKKTILIVDDSKPVRKVIANILKRYNYNTLEAEDGEDALKVIEQNKGIQVVITDYNMPKMDGYELIQRLRNSYDKDEMAIIGLSANDMKSVSTRFLKHGANDFLKKPFEDDELHIRVGQNIELLDKIGQIKDFANKDLLTGLHNRRYFFDAGAQLYQNARQGHITLTCGMVDIDHFKKLNDTYGHHAGDLALKALAGVLEESFERGDLIARLGEEEFCVLSPNMPDDDVQRIFEEVRERIGSIVIEVGGNRVSFTASIGVSTILGKDLDDMIGIADDMLYRAKEDGRDRVKIH